MVEEDYFHQAMRISTSRQRMLDALSFNNPDKIPVIYNIWHPGGLARHGQKMIDLYMQYPPDNPIAFGAIPAPPPGTIQPDGKYHEIKKDEWGTVWQSVIFGIAGHPVDYPFENWAEATGYAFPPLPVCDTQAIQEQKKQYFITGFWVSIFQKICELRPIDEVLMSILEEDEDLLAFLDRLVDYWQKVIQIAIDGGMDAVMFGDDWGTETSTTISPGLFRKLFKPRYEKLMKPIKNAGRKVFFHSCGHLGEIFDELAGLGIDCLWPQIRLHESDPHALAKCLEKKIAIYVHPDRQRLIPLGTPAEIDAEIRRYCEQYKKNGGGAIFHVEMESDTPFENVEALILAIHKYR
jgi:hypothetical protein